MEELEVRLGLRAIESLGIPELGNTKKLSDSPIFWTHGYFFKKPWTQSRTKIGYFARTELLFSVFFFIGIASAVISFVTSVAVFSSHVAS